MLVALAPSGAAGRVTETPGDAGFVIAGSQTAAGLGLVRVFADADDNDTYETLADDVTPYAGAVMDDGVRVAGGDLDGDGIDELITASSESGQVKIYELGPDGSVGAKIGAVAGFDGGTFVATGDLNADGTFELVTSADAGGVPRVRIYSDLNQDGVPSELTDQFNAYPATATGGVRVALGDTDNEGRAELITVPGGDAQPVRVREDNDVDLAVSDEPVKEQFTPFGAGYADGLYVAAGPVENAGSGGADVAISRSVTGRTVIRTDSDADGLVGDNTFDTVARPYNQGTARLALGDTDHSGTFTELITGPSDGPRPVQIFDDNADSGALISDNPLDDSFDAFTGNPGVHVAFARVVPPVAYDYPGQPQFITDLSTINSTLNVPASGGIIRDLDVTLNIAHTFVGDLDVTLTHVPSGVSVPLFSDIGGTDEGLIIRLNDEAGTDIGTADNPTDGPITGSFNPEDAALLSAFDGGDASGRWRLQVVDDSGTDTGTLMGWGLRITY